MEEETTCHSKPEKTGATTGGLSSQEQLAARNGAAWTRVRGDQIGSKERSAQSNWHGPNGL